MSARNDQITQDGQVVVEEEQHVVYREALSGGAPSAEDTPTVPAEDGEWSIDVSPTLLFRFSALTYNAHRIHHDLDYARDLKGYPGVVTHGPLQAQAMAEAPRRPGYDGNLEFEDRVVSPLFDHQGMVVRAWPGPEAGDPAVHDRRPATRTLRRIGR
ncbi:hypothetical protein [Saccharopolyspora spinosa]|uniref:hypothetical protein n=1 Tax=Saccharopolyspora spinosa TaxID=60894 RepID=UPI00117A469D|nr:hypothetical protein [Saccharopolyspora spinosa]